MNSTKNKYLKTIPLFLKIKKRMTKKCIYCGAEIPDESVIDFCESCGKKVWGEKMFNAILKNMEDAKANGDLGNSDLPEKENN